MTPRRSSESRFVANVPLFPETDPPPELGSLPAEHVFCLDIEEDRLIEQRR